MHDYWKTDYFEKILYLPIKEFEVKNNQLNASDFFGILVNNTND